MGSSTGGADQIRYQGYVAQMERQQDADIKDKEDDHKEKITRLVSTNTEQTSELKKDYDVKISQEAEMLKNKLGLIRDRNAVLIDQEHQRGEQEAEKVHHQYAQKIENEKRIGDDQLARLQTYYKRAADELEHGYDKEKTVKTAQKGKTS